MKILLVTKLIEYVYFKNEFGCTREVTISVPIKISFVAKKLQRLGIRQNRAFSFSRSAFC